MEVYFDGYCPESLLRGKQVEMRLNEDDFWESVETGLQISVFPPHAAILRWRGAGKFRQSCELASNSIVGLILTEAKDEDGEEIFRDLTKVITSTFDLDWYIGSISASRAEFEADKLDPNAPELEKQREYLKTVPKENWVKLLELFRMAEQETGRSLSTNRSLSDLHHMLYEKKLIFDFRWMVWKEGWKNLDSENFDFKSCTALDLSMYLTAIFRGERFTDGTIEHYFRNGKLTRIFDRFGNLDGISE
jgi:hypothetical protein